MSRLNQAKQRALQQSNSRIPLPVLNQLDQDIYNLAPATKITHKSLPLPSLAINQPEAMALFDAGVLSEELETVRFSLEKMIQASSCMDINA